MLCGLTALVECALTSYSAETSFEPVYQGSLLDPWLVHVLDWQALHAHCLSQWGSVVSHAARAMVQRNGALGKQYLYASRSHFYLTGTTSDSAQWRLLKLSRGGRDQVLWCWRFPPRRDAITAMLQCNLF